MIQYKSAKIWEFSCAIVYIHSWLLNKILATLKLYNPKIAIFSASVELKSVFICNNIILVCEEQKGKS